MHAQLHLGFCYAQGRGVPQSLTDALAWHRKAAAQGHAGAAANADAAVRGLQALRVRTVWTGRFSLMPRWRERMQQPRLCACS